MPLGAGERRSCGACHQLLIGAAHARTRRVAPIVLEPTENGNCIIWRDEDGLLLYAVVGNPGAREYLRGLGVPLRFNHFADCPAAARFHRDKEGEEHG
jgi:hypothetical protein